MTRNKKIGLWTAGTIGSVLLLLIVAMIVLPWVVDQDRIRKRIQNALSREAGGEIDFASIRASVLPPGGKVYDIRVSLPDISGTAETIDAGLDMSQLLRGKIVIDEIVIRNPNFSMSLPEPSETEETDEAWTAERVRKKVEELLTRLGQNMPNGRIVVRDGVLLLTREGEPLYSFKELNARVDLPPDALQISLAASSNVWDTLTFEGRIDSDGSDAAGELKVQELGPEALAGYFEPGALKDFESASISLEVDFRSPNLESVKGNLRGSAEYEKIPYPVEIADSEFALSGKGLLLNDFNVRAGESYAGASWARLTLGEEKNLIIESAAAELRLGRIFPWAIPLLSRLEGVKEIAEDYEEVKGDFSFFSVELRGPLAKPQEWKFEGEGSARNVVVETENLPAPVTLKYAEFEGDRQRMNVDLRQVGFLGSSLALSGYVDNPLSKAATADATVSGNIDSETVAWIARRLESTESQIKALQGEATITELNVSGPILRPAELSFQGSGEVRSMSVETGFVPGPVAIPQGGFSVEPEKLSLKNARVGLLDSVVTVSGDVNGYADGVSSLDLELNGTLSEKAAAWLKQNEYVPAWLNVSAPVKVSEGTLVWGREQDTAFSADFSMDDGPRLELSLVNGSAKLNIENLTVQDENTQASMSITFGGGVVDLDFSGSLDGRTIDQLVAVKRDPGGWIRGDFSLRVPVETPIRSRVQGAIQAGGIAYAGGLKAPVLVRELSIQGEGERIRIDSADLVWRETDIKVDGDVGFSEEGVVLDLVAATEGFEWEKIDRIVEEEATDEPLEVLGAAEGAKTAAEAGEETEATATAETDTETWQGGVFEDLQLDGKVVLIADYFRYGDLTWEPLHMTVNLEGNRVGFEFAESAFCGIQTEAAARLSPEPMQIEAEAEAQDKSLRSTLDCFLENRLMSGEFDLSGAVVTRGEPANLLDNLQGRFDFRAEDGRIFRFGLLSKVLAVVNITEILKLRAPDIRQEGFGYNSIRAAGEIESGVLTLEETYIDGRSVDIAFVGSLDIAEEQVDLTVLVTPLQTVDSIIESIPIVGHIVGDNFMAIPVRVKGDLANPSIAPMSPSAVGRGLLGIVNRTLKLPVRIVQPFIPDEN